MQIQSYSPKYEKEVIALWERCNLVRPVNNPKKDIQRKMKVNPDLFLIGLIEGKVVATAMGVMRGTGAVSITLASTLRIGKKGWGDKSCSPLKKN